MSHLAATVTAAPRRRANPAVSPPERRRLRLVTPALPRRRLSISVLCLIIIGLGLLGTLLLGIVVSHGTFTVEKLDKESQLLAERKGYLIEDISYRSSPQNVAAAAEELGMKVDNNPIYIDLNSGKTIEPEDSTPVSDAPGEDVTGPGIDTRDELRPNLRSNQKLPPVNQEPEDGQDKGIAPPAQMDPR